MDKNIRLKIAILFVGTVLVMLAVTGGLCYLQYENDLKNAHRETKNIAVSLHEHANRELYRVLDLLLDLGSLLQVPIRSTTWDNDLQRLLHETRHVHPYVIRIQILDGQGQLCHDSKSRPPRQKNYSDQDYFQTYTTHTGRDYFIGNTKIDAETQLTYIPVSHAVMDKTGDLNGVLVAWVAVDLFHDLYRSFDIGKESVIAMLRQDGWLLARVPAPTEMIGKNFASAPIFKYFKTSRNGTFESLYTHDQSPYISGFSRLDDLNLVVIVGRDKENLLRSWRQMVRNLIFYAFAIILVFVTFSVLLLHQIRGRQKIEDSLSESEKKFRNIFDSSGDAVFIHDMEGHILEVNQVVCKRLGYTRDELLQLTLMKIDAPGFARPVTDRIKELSKNRGLVFESAHQSKDGSVFPVEINSRIMEFEGKPCILSLARDITERKKAVQLIREKEQFQEALLNTMLAFVGLLKPDGDIFFINHVALKAGGLELQNIKGEKFYDAAWWTYSDEVRNEIKREVERCAAGHSLTKDTQIQTADGSLLWVEHSMHPVCDEYGTIQYLMLEGRDISGRKKVETALKKSEKKYRSILESMRDAVCIVSPAYRIEYMNPKMIQTLGHDASGETCHKAVYNMDERCEWCVMDQIQQGGIDEYELTNPTSSRTYIISNVPIINADETISKLAILRDTTDKKEMENRLLQAQKMEAIGTFAGGIAHDFNNILFSMLGFLELAMEDVTEDSPVYKNLVQALIAAHWAKKMVGQILTFRRKGKVDKKPVQLQFIIHNTLNVLMTSLPSTISVNKTIDENCPLVLADTTRIQQILMNLTINASHAMRKTGGVLEFSLTEEEIKLNDNDLKLDPGIYVKLSVSDTGHGIDHQILDNIFDPYFTTKGPGKGIGMGLAVVHGIVTEFNGAIKVNSQQGKGTVFHIYLPKIDLEPYEQKEEPVETDCTGTEHILLIDDDKLIGLMIQRTLKRQGYSVTAHSNSIKALEIFKASPDIFDLVLTDMTMPNMTGVDLFHEFKAVRPEIPVIVFTGFSEILDEEKAERMGFSAFVPKPIDKSEVVRTVRNVLDKSANS